MPAVKLSPLFNGQTVTSSGAPASGYKVYTYAAGSSTSLATYTDSTGNIAQSNPIILNAAGYAANSIWLQTGLAYKFVLKDANDVVVGSPWDNVTGINDSASSTSQWLSATVQPTFVSATTFTVPGDQTSEFHAQRRAQLLVSAGTVYGAIQSSSFGASVTTVVMSMDAGSVLDSGLTSVNLSILRASPAAIPAGVGGTARCQGLIGTPNSTTPLTKYDLSADAVALRNNAGNTVARFVTGTLTCDLGLAGPAANGRDQAGAFAINSWIHLYFIWNGTTIATLASTTAPASFTGSNMPSGYTHWCYATTVRWNASSNIFPCVARGKDVFSAGSIRVLNAGTALAITSISCSSAAPPVSTKVKLRLLVDGNFGAVGTSAAMSVNYAGSAVVNYITSAIQQVSGVNVSVASLVEMATDASQNIEYRMAVAPSSGGGYIDVVGYTIPNGDA